MKKWVKGILIGVGVLFFLFAVLIGVLVYKDLKQEEILKNEIINFSNKDLENDDFTVDVVTTGDYAYVEEAIKKYYKSLSDSVKELNNHLTDKSLNNLLAPSNLASDRGEYSKSRSVLKNSKDKINKALENIDKLCDEDTILNLIDRDKLDDYDYYYDFYLKLMYTDKDKEKFKELKKEMDELIKSMNKFLDKADEILVYLKENDSVVEYKYGRIYFSDNAVLDKYNGLVVELQRLALEFSGSNSSTSNEISDDKKLTET